jgi:dTDP-4-amino-4,6-dideoxygalactose transaminase
MTQRIPLLVPDMPLASEIGPYLARIDAARWYTNFGPLVRELEAGLVARMQAQRGERGDLHLVSVANCTVGLELSLQAIGLPPGALVLLPSFTFVATATAVLRAGMLPAAADVDGASWLLTPALAREAIAELARAGRTVDCVMPVATFGCPQDVAGWDAFSEDTGVPVLVDAAGAFGNQQAGRRTAVVFSFHATKSLGMGEGGAVVSTDAGFIERIRRLTNFGITLPGGIVHEYGTNAKLSEYHAAVGLAALGRWPQAMQRRRALARDYLAELARTCPAVTPQHRPVDGVYTIMAVCLPAGSDVPAVMQRLAADGVETRRWYCPLIPDHPGLAQTVRAGTLPTAQGLAGRILGLPFHPGVSQPDIARACAALASAMEA